MQNDLYHSSKNRTKKIMENEKDNLRFAITRFYFDWVWPNKDILPK